jgi:hypothetical protein
MLTADITLQQAVQTARRDCCISITDVLVPKRFSMKQKTLYKVTGDKSEIVTVTEDADTKKNPCTTFALPFTSFNEVIIVPFKIAAQ